MSVETMAWMAFDFKVKVVQMVVAFGLLIAVKIHKAETTVDKLDKQWMLQTLLGLIIFLIAINAFQYLPRMLPRQPIMGGIIIRVFAGAIVTGYYHIVKGFTLYEDLTKKEQEDYHKHSSWIHTLRIISLYVLVIFAVYLTISLICLIKLGGIDGQRL